MAQKSWRMGVRFRSTAFKVNGKFPEGELVEVGKRGVKGNQTFGVLQDGDNQFEVELNSDLVPVAEAAKPTASADESF
jgi:hypothetical protein